MTHEHYTVDIGGIEKDGTFGPVTHTFKTSTEAGLVPDILSEHPVLAIGFRCSGCCALPEEETPKLDHSTVVENNTVTFSIACPIARKFLKSFPENRRNLNCADGSHIKLAINV